MRIFLKQWWMQTCLVGTKLLQRPTLIQRPERKKMWQNCWGQCELSERQMKCRLGGWQLWRKLWEDILIWRGLAEIVKPAKMVMDQTPVPTAPSQSTVPKEVTTVVDSGTPKLYPSSSINTLGIRIFECPVCKSTFRNHGTADAHIRKEHTKMKYGPCTKCGFTSWNGDSFHAHSKKHK